MVFFMGAFIGEGLTIPQIHRPCNPTPTLSLPLKGREWLGASPFKGREWLGTSPFKGR